MKNMNFLRSNFKFLGVMLVVIVLGMVGITYAVRIGNSKSIALNIDTATMDAEISYDSSSNEAVISSIGNMFPISDDLVTGVDVNDSRVVKAKFIVSNVSTNPSNSIYDIVLRDINMDCELKTEYLKWRLYKNDTLLSEGNFSPTFDTMEDNRLVLTETQQNLTTSSDTYVFLMWISESCPKSVSIEQCTIDLDQSRYLNKNFSANIKLELATGAKKNLVRNVGNSESCNYTSVTVPSCNTLVYNGEEQQLINNSSEYTLVNASAINAGKYVVTAKLNDGYKWSDGTTSDKLLSCNMSTKTITVTSLEQVITYGEEIDNTVSNINVSGLIDGDTLASFKLTSSIVDVGSGIINVNNVKILDSSSNDVTNNYDVNINEGKVTINCLNTAEEPTVSDMSYNGTTQVGVTGGQHVILSGSLSGTLVDTYTAYAEPTKNYCWYDGKTDKKEYNWQIIEVERTEPNLTVSSDSLNTSSSSSNDLTYSYDGDGTLSCSSSSTSVATCTITSSSNKITIKSVGAGTATITLSAAASDLYTPVSKKIYVSVTGTLSGGSVNITGTNTYGETLTANVTDTTPAATYQYQWYYNTTNSTSGGTLISGANASTYEIGSGLAGKYIYVVVTASKDSYNSKSFSDITDSSNNTTATVSKADPRLEFGYGQIQGYYPDTASDHFRYLGNGTTTCSTSDSSIATCEVSDGEIILTPNSVGTVNYTVNLSEGTNYTSATYTSEATFEYKPYKITLNNQSATSAGTTTLYGRYYNGVFLDSAYANMMTTTTNSITLPSRTGYTFGGYYTGTSGSGTQLLSSSGYITSNFTNTRYSSDTTLYAKWTAKTYTVSYNANGGSGAPASQTKTYGKTLKLDSTIPVFYKSESIKFAFKGWSTSSTATTATYSAGDSYTTNADATLYAVWGDTATVKIYGYLGNNYTIRYTGEVTPYDSLSASITITSTGSNEVTCSNQQVGYISSSAGNVFMFKIDSVTADTECYISKPSSGSSGEVS